MGRSNRIGLVMNFATGVEGLVESKGSAARKRFAKAVQRIATEKPFDPEMKALPELELLEASTALTTVPERSTKK